MNKIVAFDLETTGLIKSDTNDPNLQPGIIEIGAQRYTINSNGKWERHGGSLKSYVKPEVFIEPEALKITGIKLEDIESARTFSELWPEIWPMFIGCTHAVTYNGDGFDFRVLEYNLWRYGFQFRFPYPPRSLDVMKIAKDYARIEGKQGVKYPKLSELYRWLFGEDFEGQHRALEDAEATARCAAELHKRGVLFL